MQLRSDELKIKALKNFALTRKYKEWVALELFVLFMSQNQIGTHERKFLDHLLKKYKINHLDWCFITPWVRDKITASTLQGSSKKMWNQMHFDFAHEIADEINKKRNDNTVSLKSFNHLLLNLKENRIPW
jgi:hypothetical protein